MLYLCKENRVARSYLGGKRIDRMRRNPNPADGYFPEEWAASVTRANNPGGSPTDGLSVLTDGRILADVISSAPEYTNGHRPALLKLLDAAERLAIQAHPTVAFAKEAFHSDSGKAECWYVLDADPDAYVYLGFREGITRAAWEECFETQDIPRMLSFLHRVPLSVGDVWYVDGGVPHAIGGGCLLAELQEPTDLMVVTERQTVSGRILPESKLHGGIGFDRMFDCFAYDGYSFSELKQRYYRHPAPVRNEETVIIGRDLTDHFAMTRCDVCGTCIRKPLPLPTQAVVISGAGTVSEDGCTLPVSAGDALFITADTDLLTLNGNFSILFAVPGAGM